MLFLWGRVCETHARVRRRRITVREQLSKRRTSAPAFAGADRRPRSNPRQLAAFERNPRSGRLHEARRVDRTVFEQRTIAPRKIVLSTRFRGRIAFTVSYQRRGRVFSKQEITTDAPPSIGGFQRELA